MHFPNIGKLGQFFPNEYFIVTNIFRHDFKHVIPGSRHGVALHDFRKNLDFSFKIFQVVAALNSEIDRRKHDHFHPKLLAIK